MPQCYYQKGRGSSDPVTTPAPTGPVARPLSDPQVVRRSAPRRERPALPRVVQQPGPRVAHEDRSDAGEGQAARTVADTLNSKGIPPAHGTNRWTAAMVRKAYVS